MCKGPEVGAEKRTVPGEGGAAGRSRGGEGYGGPEVSRPRSRRASEVEGGG